MSNLREFAPNTAFSERHPENVKNAFFFEKLPLFAVSSGIRQDVLLWKMIARYH